MVVEQCCSRLPTHSYKIGNYAWSLTHPPWWTQYALEQPTDSGRFALYFADLEAPTILSLLLREHGFSLSLATQIADIRALPDTRAHMHIQRELSLALVKHQRERLLANELEHHAEGIEVGSLSQHMRAFAHPQGLVDGLRIATAAWAHTPPTQPAFVICNATLQFGVRRQLMFPSHGTDKKCLNWKHKPAALAMVVPERCGTLLDAHSHHAQVCCQFLHACRHNAIRNLLQRYASEAGYTALAEQFALSATTCPDTHLNTQTSTKRGLERADLYLVSPEGVGVYIDLRITTVPYAADVVNHLAEQERQKRQQYARAAVKPVIISTLGHLAMDAHALFSQLTSMHARSALHADTTWAALLANARRALFQPLSVLLLRNA
eukprot:1932149-Amphidinium_carterae.1